MAASRVTTLGRLDVVAARALLLEAFEVSLDAVSAPRCVPPHLPPAPKGRTFIAAIGKAAAAMARTAVAHLDGPVSGIVVTRYGHAYPASDMPECVEVIEAGHPLPDDSSVAAAERMLAEVAGLGPDDLLLALVSGGGSAVLSMPADGVSLADKQALTRELLRCGASISEINCVRTHLSQIKGGRLALAAAPAQVVTLAFSDIPGDDPALIASGPTVADRTTLADARHILEHYDIEPPASIAAALADDRNESPGSQSLDQATTRVCARSQTALRTAGQFLAASGFRPVYLGDDVEGDATETGTIQAALALHHARKGGRWALLSGGETTVVVRNRDGRGGRNSEYLLALALGLDGAPGIHALACDTDGIDGTEDNAGAVIGPDTLERAIAAGLHPQTMLRRNQCYELFAKLDDLVVTGPTRTNVNDLRIILIDR